MFQTGVKFKTVKNSFPEMKKAIKAVNGSKIQVGVFGEQAWLAGIHEYGCHIKAGNSKYLTVPLIPEAVGKKAKSFSDLFVYTSKNNKKFLARSVGGKLELVYWLTESVDIPERSFLRAGFDQYHEQVIKKSEKLLGDVINGTMSEEQFFETIGTLLSSKIKKFARDLSAPPKHSITLAQHPGKPNPLVLSGDMIGAIDYEVSE